MQTKRIRVAQLGIVLPACEPEVAEMKTIERFWTEVTPRLA
jgi:hypothetical protein